MSYIDIIISLIVAWGAFSGFRKGLVLEAGSLIAIIAGIYGALEFSFVIRNYLADSVDWSERAIQLTSFICTFLAIVIIINLIARAFQKIIKAVALSMINRIFGLIFGAAKYLVIVSGLLYVLNTFNQRYPFIDDETLHESLLYHPLAEIIPNVYPSLSEPDNEIIH